MKANVINKSGYKVPVFEAKVVKKDILYDQPADPLGQGKCPGRRGRSQWKLHQGGLPDRSEHQRKLAPDL